MQGYTYFSYFCSKTENEDTHNFFLMNFFKFYNLRKIYILHGQVFVFVYNGLGIPFVLAGNCNIHFPFSGTIGHYINTERHTEITMIGHNRTVMERSVKKMKSMTSL